MGRHLYCQECKTILSPVGASVQNLSVLFALEQPSFKTLTWRFDRVQMPFAIVALLMANGSCVPRYLLSSSPCMRHVCGLSRTVVYYENVFFGTMYAKK